MLRRLRWLRDSGFTVVTNFTTPMLDLSIYGLHDTLMLFSYSKIDQENLRCLVKEWEEMYKGDRFFYRPAAAPSEEEPVYKTREPNDEDDEDDEDEVVPVDNDTRTDSLLFVHQSQNQQHLMNR